mgnify:CR=1 FL=1
MNPLNYCSPETIIQIRNEDLESIITKSIENLREEYDGLIIKVLMDMEHTGTYRATERIHQFKQSNPKWRE